VDPKISKNIIHCSWVVCPSSKTVKALKAYMSVHLFAVDVIVKTEGEIKSSFRSNLCSVLS